MTQEEIEQIVHRELSKMCDKGLLSCTETLLEHSESFEGHPQDTAFVDYIDGFDKVEKTLEAIKEQDELVRDLLYNCLFCYVVSIMDNCITKELNYLVCFVPDKDGNIMNPPKIHDIKAQNINSIHEYFKNNFNVETPCDDFLYAANHVRNKIMHNLGRNRDTNMTYQVKEKGVREAMKHVRTYLFGITNLNRELLIHQVINNKKTEQI